MSRPWLAARPRRPQGFSALVAAEYADAFVSFPDASDQMVADMFRMTTEELQDCLRREKRNAAIRVANAARLAEVRAQRQARREAGSEQRRERQLARRRIRERARRQMTREQVAA